LISRNDENPDLTPCPTCNEPTPEDAEHFPFCSKRCRMVDLNKWLKGDYKISRPIEQSDLEAGD